MGAEHGRARREGAEHDVRWWEEDVDVVLVCWMCHIRVCGRLEYV